MHSTLSHLQFPHGEPSTTSHRTLRARQDTHARAALRLATFVAPWAPLDDGLFFGFTPFALVPGDMSLDLAVASPAASGVDGSGDRDIVPQASTAAGVGAIGWTPGEAAFGSN